MARREPALCKATTQTAGTGTYTLDVTPTAAGYQTLAQAVARGLAANGDEIIYRVSDPSDPVLYEVGRGVIGSAGQTVTRAEILERDDGSTSPKSWPSGGARNFVVTFWPGELVKAANNGSEFTAATFATNLGLPRLAATNTFTAIQTIEGAGPQLIVSAPAGQSECQSRLSHTDGGQVWALRLTSTDDLRFRNVTAGTEPLVLSASTGNLTNAAGNKYVAFPTGGTVGIVFTTAPPVGFTRQNRTGERVLRFAGAADTPGAEGGSWTVSGLSATIDPATLSAAQLAAHTHSLENVVTGSGGANTGLLRVTNGFSVFINQVTGSSGSGSSHSHTGSVSSSGTWRPPYRIVCEATHD